MLDQDESVPESDQQPGPFQSETLQDLFNEVKNFGQDILEPGADEIADYEFEEPTDIEEQPEIIDEPEPVESSRAIFRDLSGAAPEPDRKSTRLNSSHALISYAVFCLKKKKKITIKIKKNKNKKNSAR